MQACPRKEELDALSESIKSLTTKVENVCQELKEFKEFVENDNLIIVVEDNLLGKLKDSCKELQSQIEEIKKSKVNNNGGNTNNSVNFVKVKIKIPIPSFEGTDQE